MKDLVVLISTLWLALLLPTELQAEKRVALVIGNGAYLHASQLRNPTNDSQDIGQALRELGFVVVEGKDLNKTDLESKLREFSVALSGADAGVFYYAGHGMQVSGLNYLVPVDAQLADATAIDFELVRLDLVFRIMERESGTNIIFLDAARDNPLARNLARSLGTRSSTIDRGLAAVRPGMGMLVSFATQPGDIALDGEGRNSPFAAALIKYIRREGLTVADLLIDVRKDVTLATGNRQVPWDYSALTSRFYFARSTTPQAGPPITESVGVRIALVIGNSEYINQGKLPNPVNDAKSVASALRRLGFKSVFEHMNLGLNGMTDVLKEFGDKAHDADWAVIFFAGHGMEINGANYLLPTDAKIERDTHVKDETISLERVLEKVTPAKRLRLVILDACRDNPFARRVVRTAGVTRSIRSGLELVDPEGDVLVIYSAKHGQVALDGQSENSPFTEAFLQYVEVPGLDLMQLIGKVRQTVLKKTVNAQGPWLYGAPTGERFFFRPQ